MTETFGGHRNRAWFDYKVIDPTTSTTLADGEDGEFCVRGFGLMAGLYKKEREQVFDRDGWYHTGDRGYLEDGDIWFTGRYSEMVKARGANVSPLEVEAVLESLPDVAMAFVLGVPSGDGGEVVAAVAVACNGATLDSEDLRSLVNQNLSAFKVPTRWKIVEQHEVPRLPSGKPNKRAMIEFFE